jgi:hypothetical protein
LLSQTIYCLNAYWKPFNKKTAAERSLRQPGCLLANRPLTLRPHLTMGLPFRCKYYFQIYFLIPALSPAT